ncbi:MAG: MFS transporter [bacterium]|nr:MFS transporter [bacterium]
MKKMGARELTILVTCWMAVSWISSDMYLPALPILDQTFPTSYAIINLTLVAYTGAMPIGAAIIGPIADRFGRLMPLRVSSIAFVVTMLACAVAPNIWILIVMRCISGLCGGGVMTMAIIYINDMLEGEELDRGITLSQSLVAIGPVVAPFIGSLMINVISWRGIFVLMTVLAIACTLWSLRLKETLPPEKRETTGVVRTIGLLFKVGRNVTFTSILIALSMPVLGFGVFMVVCSYVFIDFYAQSNFVYSIYYGIASVISIGGPMLYFFLQKRTSAKNCVRIILYLLLLSAILLIFFGDKGPTWYIIGILPMIFSESMARPCSYLVLLKLTPDNIGSATGLINLVYGLLAAAGTPIASMSVWSTVITATAWPMLYASVLAIVIFAVLLYVIKTKAFDVTQDEPSEVTDNG